MLLNHLKKQASSFLQDKYRTARLVFTDVTQAELFAEEATNNDPWSPDTRTMARIAEASFDVDDYWRIVDVLHKRLYSIDWKLWRQSYKSLVLLDFLLTHGPEEFAEEFQCDTDVIQELGTLVHIDDKGFNWGVNMQKKSEGVLQLLKGGELLKEARLKALKVTKEIQGFGSSPSSSSSSSASPFSDASSTSFGSFSVTSSTGMSDIDEPNKHEQETPRKEIIRNNSKGPHLWDCPPIQETGSLLDQEEERGGFVGGICSKLSGISPSKFQGEKTMFRSFSDVGKDMKKRFDRQFSNGY